MKTCIFHALNFFQEPHQKNLNLLISDMSFTLYERINRPQLSAEGNKPIRNLNQKNMVKLKGSKQRKPDEVILKFCSKMVNDCRLMLV